MNGWRSRCLRVLRNGPIHYRGPANRRMATESTTKKMAALAKCRVPCKGAADSGSCRSRELQIRGAAVVKRGREGNGRAFVYRPPSCSVGRAEERDRQIGLIARKPLHVPPLHPRIEAGRTEDRWLAVNQASCMVDVFFASIYYLGIRPWLLRRANRLYVRNTRDICLPSAFHPFPCQSRQP